MIRNRLRFATLAALAAILFAATFATQAAFLTHLDPIRTELSNRIAVINALPTPTKDQLKLKAALTKALGKVNGASLDLAGDLKLLGKLPAALNKAPVASGTLSNAQDQARQLYTGNVQQALNAEYARLDQTPPNKDRTKAIQTLTTASNLLQNAINAPNVTSAASLLGNALKNILSARATITKAQSAPPAPGGVTANLVITGAPKVSYKSLTGAVTAQYIPATSYVSINSGQVVISGHNATQRTLTFGFYNVQPGNNTIALADGTHGTSGALYTSISSGQAQNFRSAAGTANIFLNTTTKTVIVTFNFTGPEIQAPGSTRTITATSGTITATY